MGLFGRNKKKYEQRNMNREDWCYKMPCAVGETVYTNITSISQHLGPNAKRPYQGIVKFTGYNGHKNYYYFMVTFQGETPCTLEFRVDSIGKDIFLTFDAAKEQLDTIKGAKIWEQKYVVR